MPSAEPVQPSLTQTSPRELLALAPVARRLPTPFRKRSGQHSGSALSRYRGGGMEYEESRHYQPGDSLRHLDARVMARRGEPFTKLYRENHERALYLCVDDRACMHFATRGRFKRVIAAQVAMLLGWKAFHERNPVAVRIIRDDGVTRFRLRHGRRGLARAAHALSTPVRWHSADETELSQSLHGGLKSLSDEVPDGALLVAVSDYRGLDGAVQRQLQKAHRHCDILLISIHDALERELPTAPGRYPVMNAQGRAFVSGGDRDVQARFSEQAAQRQQRLETLARVLKAPLLALVTDCVPAEELQHFLRGTS